MSPQEAPKTSGMRQTMGIHPQSIHPRAIRPRAVYARATSPVGAGRSAWFLLAMLTIAVLTAAMLTTAMLTAMLTALRPSLASAADLDSSRQERAEKLKELLTRQTGRSDAAPGVLAGIDLRRASKSDRKVVRVLKSTKVDIALEKQPLEATVRLLGKISGLTFVISKKAREALKKDSPEVTFALKGLPLENFLNLLVLQLPGYRFTVRYGGVTLIRQEEHRPQRILRIYVVNDILRRRPNFPAPPMALGASQQR